ncbi:MAG TPA: N-6 DNA methylase [Chitinophagales bacterium]|nr:N-6 DNA methylase [Chitinophagales bacterium]
MADAHLQIGAVFTPLLWAKFAVKQTGLYQKWLNGATIFDPTMGEGNLLAALIETGLDEGKKLCQLPTRCLFGNELNTQFYTQALCKFNQQYGLQMETNFTNHDFLTLPAHRFDLIFGNPPWQNFADLPQSYKQKVKPFFLRYHLAPNAHNLLLGNSRIDIAALIVQRAMQDFLQPNGEAVFFLPLSLLLNDGANRYFRTFSIDDGNYALETVYDFNDTPVFTGIHTRYCLCWFVRNKKTRYPIPYYIAQSGNFTKHLAQPLFHPSNPLSILEHREENFADSRPLITLKKESCPRQGINTGGANHVFFFDSCEPLGNGLVKVANKFQKQVTLPDTLVYPLITGANFSQPNMQPAKWVFLPYCQNGKPLTPQQLKDLPTAYNYLNLHKNLLQNRKGVLLNALLKRGYWWALLGVGAYNFYPYKIVWQAYGKTTFKPKLFIGSWQANQALQAYIPVQSEPDALSVLHQLTNKKIEQYLLSQKMQGTMNWAQPGKIKKLSLLI